MHAITRSLLTCELSLLVILLIVNMVKSSKEKDVTTSAGPKLPVDVLMTFTKAENNRGLSEKFELCVSSMLHHATTSINLHVIGDKPSQEIAQAIVRKLPGEDQDKVKVR